MTDPFAPKFYSLIQNNIDPNFSEGLNFFTCEQSLSHVVFVFPFKSTSVFAGSGSISTERVQKANAKPF